MAEVSEKKPRRTDRRRAVTRGRLMDAARALFAEKGVEATRINEITERADVGFGSFYTHFSSKEEITEAVVREVVTAKGKVIDELARDRDDVAEIVAAAHCHWMELARTDPMWVWLVLRLDLSHRLVFETLGQYALRDVRVGVAEGRFDVPDETVAVLASGGALLANMRAVLEGVAGPDAGRQHAECVLRMFGMTKAQARTVAGRVTLTPLGAGAPTG